MYNCNVHTYVAFICNHKFGRSLSISRVQLYYKLQFWHRSVLFFFSRRQFYELMFSLFGVLEHYIPSSGVVKNIIIEGKINEITRPFNQCHVGQCGHISFLQFKLRHRIPVCAAKLSTLLFVVRVW